MAGNTLVHDKLICGCLELKHEGAIKVLAERADTTLQAMLSSSTLSEGDKMEMEDEVNDTRRQFVLAEDVVISPELYRRKIGQWFTTVKTEQIAPLYHRCAHPDCAEKVENWMLKEDFEKQNSSRWVCPMGHQNSVLPSEADIREYNRIILTHPEYYIQSCSYSQVPLRRRRFCKGCVSQGTLMIAEHSDACKHWPGDERQHRHAFCFACCRTWNSECSHSARDCADPGIQQVRRREDDLEIGFVNGQQYIEWINGARAEPPDTIFPSEPRAVSGADRQRDLAMENKSELLRDMQ
jgi:hypothetical protein